MRSRWKLGALVSETARSRLRYGAAVVVALAFIGSFLLFSSPTAAAQNGDGNWLEPIEPWAPILLIIGIVGFFALLVTFRRLKVLGRILGISAVSAILLIAVWAIVQTPDRIEDPCVVNPDLPQCVSLHADLNVQIASTPQGSVRNTAAEIFDSQGGNGDGDTPAATLCDPTAGSGNVNIDRVNRKIIVKVTVDDDVATSDATFSAPDMCSLDYSIRLGTTVDADGNGVDDSISIYARWSSLSATTTEDGNGSSTQRNIFYKDTTYGWYVGFGSLVDTQATDGEWYSACQIGISDTRLPTTPTGECLGWVRLGSTDGADEDFMAAAWVWKNYGGFGFSLPDDSHTYTYILEFAGPDLVPDPENTWTYDIILDSRD